MKLSILQEELLPSLQSVARSCGVRNTLPVLANVLLSAQANTLKLSATNLEVGVVKSVSAKVISDGETTVPAKTFLEMILDLPTGEVQLELEGDILKVSAHSFSASLNTIAAAEFPSIPLASDQPASLEAEVLSRILPKISFAAATDEGRPVLTGILTELKKDSLEMVATDGFRLAHQKVKVSGADLVKALIPRRTLEELTRLIDEEEGVATVELSTSENQNQMVFKIGSSILSSRLIEGQFPSWEKIIPESASTRVIIDRVELLKAVKLASVFAKDSANIVKLETKEKGIKLTSEAKELGGQESEVSAQVEGQGVVIAFNARFLIDALSAPSAAQVLIELSGSLSPALIKPVGEDGLEYVIMPVRLS